MKRADGGEEQQPAQPQPATFGSDQRRSASSFCVEASRRAASSQSCGLRARIARRPVIRIEWDAKPVRIAVARAASDRIDASFPGARGQGLDVEATSAVSCRAATRQAEHVVMASAALALVVLVALPLAFLVAGSVTAEGAVTLAHFRDALSSRLYVQALRNSLILGAGRPR